jgi:hypothetical protein
MLVLVICVLVVVEVLFVPEEELVLLVCVLRSGSLLAESYADFRGPGLFGICVLKRTLPELL